MKIHAREAERGNRTANRSQYAGISAELLGYWAAMKRNFPRCRQLSVRGLLLARVVKSP